MGGWGQGCLGGTTGTFYPHFCEQRWLGGGLDGHGPRVPGCQRGLEAEAGFLRLWSPRRLCLLVGRRANLKQAWAEGPTQLPRLSRN